MTSPHGIEIISDPRVAGGAPLLVNEWGACPRVVDLLDRVRAGDRVDDVARDFSVATASLRLLLEAVR